MASPPPPPIPISDSISSLQSDIAASSDDSDHGNPSIPNGVNGLHSNHLHQEAPDAPDDNEGEEGSDEREPLDNVEKLQQELERTRGEKEALAEQYRNLLGKLTTMRTTLGNKLREDAVSSVLLPPYEGPMT